MAAITGSTGYRTVPGNDRLLVSIVTPATADSADTLDVSDTAATGLSIALNTVDAVWAVDVTTGDAVTATVSGTTITIDAAGATTNKVYALMVLGQA
jgi:hypothetical protein